MNIHLPDKNSLVYRQFIDLINAKVNTAINWLEVHGVEYIWNYQINNHLYRLYIPQKDLLLDFETYPLNNRNYSYIRINYNSDIILILEKVFAENVIETNDMEIWKLTQRASNRFLKENLASPIYDKSVLRLGWVKNNTIYQSIILKGDKIISNVIKQGYSVPFGTYMLLRNLNEYYGIDNIIFQESMDNSFANMTWQILNLPVIAKTPKKKIWWNPNETKWRITESEKDKYISFYFTEDITYLYPPKEKP